MAKRVSMKLSLSKRVSEMLEQQVAVGLYPDANTAVEQAVLQHVRVRTVSSVADIERAVLESLASGKSRPLTNKTFDRLRAMVDRAAAKNRPATRRKTA